MEIGDITQGKFWKDSQTSGSDELPRRHDKIQNPGYQFQSLIEWV